jgi:hypothetical protein
MLDHYTTGLRKLRTSPVFIRGSRRELEVPYIVVESLILGTRPSLSLSCQGIRYDRPDWVRRLESGLGKLESEIHDHANSAWEKPF